MIKAVYYDSEGKERTCSIENGADTNLMLSMKKSAFTMLRSSFVNGEGATIYEYWVKFPYIHNSLARDDTVFYNTLNMVAKGKMFFGFACSDFPISRPSSFPDKLKFDSNRTAYAPTFVPGINPNTWEANTAGSDYVHNFCYCGYANSSDASVGTNNGDFDLYGLLFFLNAWYESWPYDINMYYLMMCSFSQDGIDAGINRAIDELGIGTEEWARELDKIIFRQKIAEVRNFEIVSNDTPDQNTYYVAIEDKKGNLLDVKTTTTFGVTVGSLIGDYADKFSESVLNQRVVDDLVIKMK